MARERTAFELGPVQGFTPDVGVDLNAHRAQLFDRTLGLGHARVGSRQRHLGDEGGEMLRMLGDQSARPSLPILASSAATSGGPC